MSKQLTAKELIKLLQEITKRNNKKAGVWTNTNYRVVGAKSDRLGEIVLLLE